MSSSVHRTAPIAIAPKPPRLEPAPYRQDSFHRLEMGQGSLPAANSASTDHASFNGSPFLPCISCRYSRASCIMSDDDEVCVRCQIAGSECSLASSPQSRKRKLNGDSASDDVIGKRRSVLACSCIPSPSVMPSLVPYRTSHVRPQKASFPTRLSLD